MKLKRKEFASVGVLLIIMSIFIVTVFSVPAIINIRDNFEISKYESTKSNIINGAKSKLTASISDLGKNDVVEYTVKELIEEGYLNADEINPLTGKKYNDDDKVLVISRNGNISYKFISGTTLIKEIKSSNNAKFIDDGYYYTGSTPENYISFNEEIYRIVKMDNENNIYIIKDSYDKKIVKSDIESYLESYINDKFSISKDSIIDIELLDLNTYKKTKNGKNLSFLDNDNYFWMGDNAEIKAYDSQNSIFIDGVDKARINPLIKIDNSLVVEKGNGSRINPYVVD